MGTVHVLGEQRGKGMTRDVSHQTDVEHAIIGHCLRDPFDSPSAEAAIGDRDQQQPADTVQTAFVFGAGHRPGLNDLKIHVGASALWAKGQTLTP